ncbi:MAG: hypothetical protein FRX48_02850 [Lasallia pustulata]|uniref:Ras-GEF domain-containing protein n=1 Tax=Lasallia pustulata TaxID=136370 RepID=A0A5M8PUM9_9LECA|nr:MAG: hypothetical protein FRX48_02850 [Lasallia pustulata]
MLEQHAVLEVRFRRSYLNPQDTDWTRRFRTDVDLFNCVTKMPAQDLADQLTDGDLTAFRSLAPQSVIDEGDRFQQMNRRWDDQCLAISKFLIIHRHLIHKAINVCQLLRKMRNFNFLFAFLQALRESGCDKSNWQDLFDLINPARNYAIYRKIKQEAPCVPFLRPHITQLKRCQEKVLSEIFTFLEYRPENWPPDLDAEDTSNGLNTTRTYDRSGVMEDDDLPTIQEQLFGARNAQEWQKTDSSDRHVTGGSEGNLEDAQQEADGIDVQTYDNLSPDGGDKEREVVRPDKSIGTHDNDTDTNGFTALQNKPKPLFRPSPTLKPSGWDKRANSSRKEPGSLGDPIDGNQGSLSTPSTSVAGPEAGCSTLDQKNKHDTPNTFPSNRNTLSSTPGKRTCGLEGGNCEGLTPDPLTDGNKKICGTFKRRRRTTRKKMERNTPGTVTRKPRLCWDLQRKEVPLDTVEGKFVSKRYGKRHRCSPPILAVQDQNHDTQADGTSPESKGVKTKIRRATIPSSPASDIATSPLTFEQAWEQGDEAQVEELEWGVKKILDKRETMSGTECKVRWEDTWLPIDELGHARKLLREFEAQRRAQHGHKRGRPARTPLSSCPQLLNF